jgi:hypothetical protein
MNGVTEFRVSLHQPCGEEIRTAQREGETVEQLDARHDDAVAQHVCRARTFDTVVEICEGFEVPIAMVIGEQRLIR